MRRPGITPVLGLSFLTHPAFADDAAERAAVLELPNRAFAAGAHAPPPPDARPTP